MRILVLGHDHLLEADRALVVFGTDMGGASAAQGAQELRAGRHLGDLRVRLALLPGQGLLVSEVRVRLALLPGQGLLVSKFGLLLAL